MHKRICAVLIAVSGFVLTTGGCAITAPFTPFAVNKPTQISKRFADSVPLIGAPPTSQGNWYDLGQYQAPWLAGDGEIPIDEAPTRVAGWRLEANSAYTGKVQDSEWLALVIVQAAPGAQAPCSLQPTSLDVKSDADGCLRMRRDADFDHWLQAAQPELYKWVQAHGWNNSPRAWAAYREPSIGGRAIEVHVLFNPSLIEPTTRNTTDFVTSGLPGLEWASQLAASVRLVGQSRDNILDIPPIPFAPGMHIEEALASDRLTGAQAPVAAPTMGEQVFKEKQYKPRSSVIKAKPKNYRNK